MAKKIISTKAQIRKEIIKEIQEDIIALCEDNEVMREAIKDYFEQIA